MTEYDLLVDLHQHNHRQGPGSDETTRKAIHLMGTVNFEKIADIGCGTGGQTLILAQNFKGTVTAVDLFPIFLNKLQTQAEQHHLSHKIKTLVASMEDLPFEKEEFDLIWSEGAIYNMGFEKGLQYWKDFLKPGGYLAVSEISWTLDKRPSQIEEYWQNHYPEIDTVSGKIKILEKQGFSPLAHFLLPENDWIDHYYLPLQSQMPAFLERYPDNPLAQKISKAEKEEFQFYQKFKNYYSYGFYIGKKL
ncbi:MAG: methyltransferase domain-containing protein [Candidatus Marinimicrobia bacterium]|nr:methyltransferase domain-containing protein [Candidatus Neomarinimicrobiota bacterium]